MLKTVQQKLHHHIRPPLAWLKLLWRRIDEDHMTTLAGNLVYVPLLSLVLLIVAAFALFAVSPMFSEVSMQTRHSILANFIPVTEDMTQGHIEQLVANSSRMTVIDVSDLIVTSLSLMYSVSSALDIIWRSMRGRPRVYFFAVHRMVLTLGPLLADVSLAINSYLLPLHWMNDLDGMIGNLLRLFPLTLLWAAFWLFYSIVPTTQVRSRDVTIGVLVVALLLETDKKAFALCTIIFPSHQLIYGVILVVPILFVQMYWTWCIALLGVEITVTLGEYHKLRTGETEQP